MRALRLLAALVICVAIAGGALAWYGERWYRSPGPLSQPVTLVFPRGDTVHGMSVRLEQAGVLQHPLWFETAAELSRSAGELKAGEYSIPAQASPEQILALLSSGRTVVHRLVVPEGLSTPEVLAIVDHAEALEGSITQAPGEGELLPQTYFYSYGDQRQALIDRMKRGMRRLVTELWERRRSDLPITTPAEAVIVASIVEKETAVPAERAKVAEVFYNRLRAGMRLQSDPTVIFAITGGKAPLDHRLDHDDLAVDSPYNTYKIDGLPPGPIDNPGRASLEAAVNPEQTNALYFVADGTGGHVFAATLAAHNKNVDRWREQRDPVPVPLEKPR